jgi:ABC-type branched-subunit amino acid transport system ATPase component
MNLLEVNQISKSKGATLKQTTFSVPQFSKISVIGETGSGKSTLLKLIAGLLETETGLIQFEGKKVLSPNEKLIPGHDSIAYLSQHFELHNNYFVHELLEYATKVSDKEAAEIFQVCQVSQLLKRKTDQLSGGERQRIGLAKLLVGSPKLLLLDEPFSNLDMLHKKTIRKVIQDLSEKLKITCLLVSHDPVDILSWSDHILVMHEGNIIQQGNPKDIYCNPINEYVAGLLGEYTIISPSSKIIQGAFTSSSNEATRFLRPESFEINTNNSNGIEGVIKKIGFCGSYYRIEVDTEEQSLILYTNLSRLRIGSQIYINRNQN